MDTKMSLFNCVGILLVFQKSIISAQLDLPSMPGPPYPDPRGQNRWGVKFDPILHGPPYDKTEEDNNKQNSYHQPQPVSVQENNYQRPLQPLPQRNTYQRPPPPITQQDTYRGPPPPSPLQSQSQDITFQRPPPPPPSFYNSYGNNNNYNNGGMPSGFNQNAGSSDYNNNNNNNNNFFQSTNKQKYQYQPQNNNAFPVGQLPNYWNSLYNNNNNYKGSPPSPWNTLNYNADNSKNKAVRPPSALNNDKPKGDGKGANYWNRIMGFFSSPNLNQNQNNNNNEAQSQPSNFRYQIDFQHPRRPPHQHWRQNKPKGRHPPQLARNKWKPKKKNQNWKIFTTIGKGMDAVNGGVNSVRKVVQGTTGRALATGVKIGGKVAYAGAHTLAKVITKAATW